MRSTVERQSEAAERSFATFGEQLDDSIPRRRRSAL